MNSVSPALAITTASNSGQARHIAVANPPSTEPCGTNSPPRTGFHRPDQGQADSTRDGMSTLATCGTGPAVRQQACITRQSGDDRKIHPQGGKHGGEQNAHRKLAGRQGSGRSL